MGDIHTNWLESNVSPVHMQGLPPGAPLRVAERSPIPASRSPLSAGGAEADTGQGQYMTSNNSNKQANVQQTHGNIRLAAEPNN